MIRIGILGDIGSGKSFVAKSFGCPVFNADNEVGKLYKKEDIKILNDDPNQSGSENQSKIEDKNQPEDVQNLDNEKIQSENENINQNIKIMYN